MSPRVVRCVRVDSSAACSVRVHRARARRLLLREARQPLDGSAQHRDEMRGGVRASTGDGVEMGRAGAPNEKQSLETRHA